MISRSDEMSIFSTRQIVAAEKRMPIRRARQRTLQSLMPKTEYTFGMLISSSSSSILFVASSHPVVPDGNDAFRDWGGFVG
jgi:hypothetical protein